MKRTYSTALTTTPPTKKRATGRRRRPTGSAIFGRTTLNEIKSFDQLVVSANLPGIATPPAFGEPGVGMLGWTCLNEIPQGATFYNRIGNKIVMKSIRVEFTLYAPNTLTTTVRAFLIYDRQPNGASPALLDLFQLNATGTMGFTTGLNMANKSRFKMLRDQYFTMDTAQSLCHHVNFYCKGRYEVEFKSSTGTIADIATGSVLFGAFIGNAVGAGYASMYDITARIRYYD